MKDHYRLKTHRKFGTRRGFTRLLESIAKTMHVVEVGSERTVSTAIQPTTNNPLDAHPSRSV